MDDSHRDLLQAWIDAVARRPGRACGIFFEDDGVSFGPRGRPWDSPDLLIDGGLHDGDLVLEADGAHGSIHVRLGQVSSVRQGEHVWGPGLHCHGSVNGAPTEVWLV